MLHINDVDQLQLCLTREKGKRGLPGPEQSVMLASKMTAWATGCFLPLWGEGSSEISRLFPLCFLPWEAETSSNSSHSSPPPPHWIKPSFFKNSARYSLSSFLYPSADEVASSVRHLNRSSELNTVMRLTGSGLPLFGKNMLFESDFSGI